LVLTALQVPAKSTNDTHRKLETVKLEAKDNLNRDGSCVDSDGLKFICRDVGYPYMVGVKE